MGIPKFYNHWLRKRGFKNVLIRGVPGYVSSFSFDLNGVIHKAAQLVYAYGEGFDNKRLRLIKSMDPRKLESQFYHVLGTLMNKAIMQIQPREILVLAVDGVAPQAKINQQRQRRFRSAMESASGNMFDSNAITPGTSFMRNLDMFLKKWIRGNQLALPPTVIYSSHMVPGEGEHKIMDMMRDGQIKGEGAHVIYGMDADLIMLSLLSPLDKIYLAREDIKDVVNIDNLKIAIQSELNSTTSIHDFVFMTFFIGNDFLPHMPSLEDLDKSMEALFSTYKSLNKSLISDGELKWKEISEYLHLLAQKEPELLKEESQREIKHPSKILRAASTFKTTYGGSRKMVIGPNIERTSTFNYQKFRSLWYNNIFIPKGNIKSLNELEDKLKLKTVTSDELGQITLEYLKGLAWVYTYYTLGPQHVNIDYVYRYHYTPLISDLAILAKSITQIEGYKAKENQVVLNPVHQLLAVLPLKSKNLLPTEVQHLMTKESPIADMYPTSAPIDRDGKNTDWEGVVLLPFVESDRIIDAVNKTTIFTPERASLFKSHFNIVIQKTKETQTLAQKGITFKQNLKNKMTQRFRSRGKKNSRMRRKYK